MTREEKAERKFRRERVATAVLAGLAARGWALVDAVEIAIPWADALIAALDEEKSE